MKRGLTCAALIALATFETSSLHGQSPTVPSDADTRQILVDRIDRDRQSVGIVVGVIDGASIPASSNRSARRRDAGASATRR